jgi:lysophospholipase L1-like esterase
MSRVILFQGDSVTDVDRRAEGGDGLGNGYPKMIAERLKEEKENSIVLNRGISGNRTSDLKERWTRDCIDLKPDILTILIGINDCWRKYDSNDETPLDVFVSNYTELLDRAKTETFPEDRKEWRVTLDPYIQAVRQFAVKYQTGLVTLDGIFAKAAVQEGYTALAEDGVHPSLLGHRLIAGSWLEEYRSR